jgi:hypothetical protein
MHLALQVEMLFPINTVGNKCARNMPSQFGAVRQDGVSTAQHSTNTRQMWNGFGEAVFHGALIAAAM